MDQNYLDHKLNILNRSVEGPLKDDDSDDELCGRSITAEVDYTNAKVAQK